MGTITTLPIPANLRYAETLKRLRLARRWSQERLALEAQADHSLISRLESGTREPTRESTTKLANALAPDNARARALLFIAAGLLPDTPADYLDALDQTVGRLYRALTDECPPHVDPTYYDYVLTRLRDSVESALDLALMNRAAQRPSTERRA